jgi:hypothetical protein
MKARRRAWRVLALAPLLYVACSGTSYGIPACDVGPYPVIVGTSSSAVAESGGGSAAFVFTIVGFPTGGTTHLTLAISGTATSGTDYEALPTTVAIAPDSTQATLALTPKPDAVTEGIETVTVTIVATDAPCVPVGSPSSATIAIVDGDALPVDASSTTIVVPIVAETASFSTEVYVRNANAQPITLNVRFYESSGSSVPGPRSCPTTFGVPAGTTSLLRVSQQCDLGDGSHFGMLILEDAALPMASKFAAYSRTQTPTGIGFSVEGYPVETFGAGVATVDGLKSSSADPLYQADCYAAALGSSVAYQLDLATQDGAPVTSRASGGVPPYASVAYRPILPHTADFTDVRAQFTETAPGGAPFIGFCTQQESISFSADFRLAKTDAAVPTPMVVPVVAKTASYDSEVYVRNANGVPLTLSVAFYEGDDSATPGELSCVPFPVPANASRMLDVGTNCPLGAGKHFGMLVLQEAAPSTTHPFAVYSRSQTPAGIGFSVEGVPLTHFGTVPVSVDGLKRSSTGPQYQSNCFVAAPGMPLDYRIDVTQGDGTPIGTPILGSLSSHHMVRYLDVLAAAHAPAGDYTNVRAIISEAAPGTSPLIGFCTMQESVSFSADFRIAK